VLANYPGVIEATVYGVAIAGVDGRAGMAAIVCDERFEIHNLEPYLNERLPEYARPVFLRILRQLEMTATFKPQKQELVRAGYAHAAATDSLFVRVKERGAFVALDATLLARIQSGELRL